MKWAILTLISILICATCWQMIDWDASGNLIAHNYSVWGDWSAHFTFISAIRERGLGWISGNNPLFFGIPFQYPFLSHLITAAFSLFTGTNVIQATLYSSLLLLFALPFMMNRFFQSLGLSTRQSILSTLLFLFIGGFQAFDSNLSSSDALTNQFKSGSVFTQFILFELIPQRAFLFGLILFLFGFTALIRRKNSSQSSAILIAFLFALLSWTHLHSWMAMALLLFVAFIYELFSKRFASERKYDQNKILKFGGLVALLSMPFLYFLLFRAGGRTAQGMEWSIWFPGWAQNSKSGLAEAIDMNFVQFWIYNTGLFLPLVIFGAKVKARSSLIDISAITGVILFVFSLLFNIQPYFYDNLKLMTYSFLFMSPMAALGIDYFFKSKKLIVIGIALFLTQTYTAGHDYWFYLSQNQSTVFLAKQDFELAQKFKELRRSPDSLVLVSPYHNHWVTTLTGNPVFMGYPGWLWTWGINYRSRENEIAEILSGGPMSESLLEKYPIEYVVVHDHDKKAIQEGKRFKSLIDYGPWHIFEVIRPN